MAKDVELILIDQIEPLIQTVRGQNVLLDKDLAAMYGTTTRTLNQAVKRNLSRFPDDFMFQLSEEEWESLRSQIVILKTGRGRHSKFRPRVFTEHGPLMAAMILNTPRAVEVSVFVIRGFIKLREFALKHKDLAQKLDELERKVGSHDDAIRGIVATIRELMTPPEAPQKRGKGKIGFGRENEE